MSILAEIFAVYSILWYEKFGEKDFLCENIFSEAFK